MRKGASRYNCTSHLTLSEHLLDTSDTQGFCRMLRESRTLQYRATPSPAFETTLSVPQYSPNAALELSSHHLPTGSPHLHPALYVVPLP